MDMVNFTEARRAFLDQHLAEFGTALPPGLGIRRARGKSALREATKGLLPEVLIRAREVRLHGATGPCRPGEAGSR